MLWVQADPSKGLICFIHTVYCCFHKNQDVNVFEEVLRESKSAPKTGKHDHTRPQVGVQWDVIADCT